MFLKVEGLFRPKTLNLVIIVNRADILQMLLALPAVSSDGFLSDAHLLSSFQTADTIQQTNQKMIN